MSKKNRAAKQFALIGGVPIAGDSTKLRVQNSKKNKYNQKKIDRHLEYIENMYCKSENQTEDMNDKPNNIYYEKSLFKK